jgi:adenine-specific DNA-methyltransferase
MNQQSYHGRLELTWTNKDEALLWSEDGSYRWVPASDYRVAEVRLLHEAVAVGEVQEDSVRDRDNLLIRGDALHALTSLARLPEFQREYLGRVKLAYLDPPFNTQQAFEQYDDALEHSVWLTMMRDRLVQIRQLLRNDGSVWVHLDDAEAPYCRVLMDEVFGRQNFVATVVWQKNYASKNTARHFSVDHDYIHVYAKDAEAWEPARLARTDEMDARYLNPDNDPRGPWKPGDLSARNFYSLGRYAITTPSGRVIPGPPRGSYWRVSPKRLEEMRADNRISFGAKGEGVPAIKRFLTEVRQGRVPQTIWLNAETGHTQEAKKEIKVLVPDEEPFATPKPERLIKRVIDHGSEPGDIVLDCFLGSGTTAAVAQKMGRRWVGVERSVETIATFALPRLTSVVSGDDPGGITKDVGWQGGGGFRVLDVAPSMFEEVEGTVVLADWATKGELAQGTAAQLGFEYVAEPPFSGVKGRSRLCVIDGLVTSQIAVLIASQLGERERVVICGTAISEDAKEALGGASAGSIIRKIPASILAEYRRGRRLFVRPTVQPQQTSPTLADAEPSAEPVVGAS